MEWLERERPDVLCLQELKAAPEQLPLSLVAPEGYTTYWHGHKGYSGVGLLLRRETFAGDVAFTHPDFDHETRVVEAHLPDFTVASLYVPNGGKDFAAKLAFLEALERRAAAARAEGRKLLLCGDLNVAVRERDVEVAAEEELPPFRPRRGRTTFESLEERELGGEVLSAVRNVKGRDREVRQMRLDDPRLVVEVRVREGDVSRERLPSEKQPDARVTLVSVPVRRVALGRDEGERKLLGRGLQLLQAENVGPLALEPLHDLQLPRPDSVHVPGDDLHRVSPRTSLRTAARAREPRRLPRALKRRRPLSRPARRRASPTRRGPSRCNPRGAGAGIPSPPWP